MNEYEHIMYASSSHIAQIFSDRYGDVSQVDLETTEEVASTVEGKLGALVGSLSGDLSGGISKSEIKKINFEEEFFQIKRVVNDLLHDEKIPRVTELASNSSNSLDLYRFSSEVLLTPVESQFDDENYLEVRGFEENVKFHGSTSLDNWGSRSHLLNAMRTGDTYPFQGVLTPVSRESVLPEHTEYVVQYLFICAPNQEARQTWYNRQNLKNDQYESG